MVTPLVSNTPGEGATVAESHLRRYAVPGLLLLVVVYAFAAGLHTIGDADTGWQLASGRYIVQHQHIPDTDVLSYTARGQEWIYPAFSEVLLYFLYLLGGYAALSFLSAGACAVTVSLGFWAEAGIASAVLAILAIPKIAYRTAPRADLFTTLLFAALLAVLWRHYRGRKAPLWLVPLIFIVWANTHLGFIAGFALLIAYVVLELADSLVAERRDAARRRLRSALPWLIAAVPATLLNPWHVKVFRALYLQERDMSSQENVIAEWRHVPLNASTLAEAFRWRNPDCGYYWLLALAVLAAAVAIKRKYFGPALLLLGAAVLSLRHIRFQALFAIVTIVVAAPFLAGILASRPATTSVPEPRAQRRRKQSQKQAARFPSLARYRAAFTTTVLVFATGLLGIRFYDLMSERAYMIGGAIQLSGVGLSSWYPVRAADFVRRERLPGNLFHDYNLGGFLAFELGPEYPDYIDGRAIPFGSLRAERRSLMRQSPDSPAWQEEADRRQINTLIFSLARYWGLHAGTLRQFCTSANWKPVYLDEVSIVLVRNRPENLSWINRFPVDCQNAKFEPPPELTAVHSIRGRAELFNYYAHAGSILFKLSRNSEAETALDRAIEMFPEEPFLHQIRGQVHQAKGELQDAENEYLTSVRIEPVEATWYALFALYQSEKRYPEAAHALEEAAQLSVHPSQYYISLGTLYVTMHETDRALDAFDAAVENSGYESPELKARIESQAAEGRTRALNAMR